MSEATTVWETSGLPVDVRTGEVEHDAIIKSVEKLIRRVVDFILKIDVCLRVEKWLDLK